ncbi:uncharacterized protein KY384_004082 [Bacidia gigantensis]|uniref:uncharacterized protein n=1 Tax=Bacidia gigantensis TaxID=2732470 RepID=UPI001D04FB02|nr:uncharacterized protein KY384_004082 [Bacidia gigantensis]KAG8530725.1 hypothetical protein KY384_004082 [Bacidia gigantensis]
MSTSPDSSREDSQLKPLLSHCSGDDTLIDPIQFMFSEEGKGGLPNFDTQLYESFGEDSDDDSIFSGISDSASDTESHREEEPKPLPSLNNGELPTDSPITAQSHTAECKSPPSLNRGELQAQMKAMVKVGIFDVFGISGDICYPRVSLDFSWPNPPSIHLTIKGPSNVVFYDNRWELDAYACSAFACQDLQVCSLPEATKHLSSGDVDIMADELGGEHPTDVVCMRFTSWPRITGRTIEGNLITSLGGLDTSFKQSLAILSKPQAPFEITIAFRPHTSLARSE